MPGPALFGLAALGAYLYSIAAAIINFVVVFFTVRTAIRLVFIGLVGTTIYGTYQGIEALVNSAAVSMPSFIAIPMTWILPANTSVCISIIVGAHVSIILMRFYIWALNVLAP